MASHKPQEIRKKAGDNFAAKPQYNRIIRVNNVNSFPQNKKPNDMRAHVCKFAQFLKRRKEKTKTII